MSNLAVRVLATLAYSDQFQFPLLVDEIQQRLIGMTADVFSIENTLENLKRMELVEQDGDWYFLKGSQKFIEIRKGREKYLDEKTSEIKEFVDWAQHIPWIKAVVVTGSVAVRNVRPHSDVDFMIITMKRRLWLSRILVYIMTWLKGRRRTWYGHEQDSWCFNLWMDESALSLPLDKHDVYTAYEVCQAEWVMDRDAVQHRFYWANEWVRDFLPQFYLERVEEAREILSKFEEWWAQQEQNFAAPVLRKIGDVLCSAADGISYLIQHGYMYPHLTREIVGWHYAFFHPRNTHYLISQRWRASLAKVLK